MGTGLFLFRTLTLKREKSDLNLLMARLGRQKRAKTREVGALARDFNQKRSIFSQQYQHELQAMKASNTTNDVNNNTSGSSGFNCFTNGANNNMFMDQQVLYQQYQQALQALEAQQQEEERRIKEEEADIEEQIQIAKTEMDQIDAELKEAEKAAEQSAKDSAPKYVA